MKRFALVLILALTILGVSYAQSDVDPEVTLGTAMKSELFRVIFNINQSVVDSARVWYASHAGLPDSVVTEDVLFDELMSVVTAKLRALETQYKQKQAAAITTTF